MKLRMALEEERFRLGIQDASRRYLFRMNDAEKIEVIGETSDHIVTVTDDSYPAAIDTDYSVIDAWLTNEESVILSDPFMEISAILSNGGNGLIVGDGVNMDSFIARRYVIQSNGGATNLTITTNGPMTQEEIIAAVTLGWNL